MAAPLVKDVSDTAYWIAHHRAAETARPDALFRDPLAGRLAGDRGRDIAAAMPVPHMIGWSVVIRTCIVDDYIRSAVARGVDTVVNLGAGLDTRPYRMGLPAALRWVEADYAHVIEHKDAVLAGERPSCRLERVKIDLADRPKRRAFLASLDVRAKRMLVLTEGVVPYLTEEEAGVLADDLRTLDRLAWWVVDYFSAEANKFRRRSGMTKAMRNAPFKFAPDDPFAFFAAHHWRVGEIRYLADEGDRLKRPMPVNPLLKLIVSVLSRFAPPERRNAFQRFAGYMLLEPS
jgi:methyltransferase (TIGR00027 family)